MVKHVIDTCNNLGAQNIHLVYGHGGDQMQQALVNENVNWVLQAQQLGTGHAVDQALPISKMMKNLGVVRGCTADF